MLAARAEEVPSVPGSISGAAEQCGNALGHGLLNDIVAAPKTIKDNTAILFTFPPFCTNVTGTNYCPLITLGNRCAMGQEKISVPRSRIKVTNRLVLGVYLVKAAVGFSGVFFEAQTRQMCD
jgi:hypothetical protein